MTLRLDEYAPFTPEMSALLNRYLEQWISFASMEDLSAAFGLSRPVAAIVKALTWHMTISHIADDTLRQEYAWIVPELFREFMIYAKMLSSR